MNRRDLITLLGGAAAASSFVGPLVARAEQQSARPLVGFLNAHSVNEIAGLVDAFLRGLSDYGYDEGRDVLIDFRWADGHYDRLPELAAELVQRKVAVIVGSDNPSALAAKRATATIPIVFTSDGGPVALGLVSSLNRPGGNVTGVGLFSGALAAKRLSLLRELVPSAQPIGMLADPKNLAYAGLRKEAQDAARSLGIKLQVLTANSAPEIDAAFAGFAQQQIRALMVGASPDFTWRRREQIVALAAKYAAAAHMRLGEALTLWGSHAALDQSFSGAAFNAVQNVSAAIFEILYGIALFLFAFIIHRRAQFYARVRAVLPSDSV